MTQRMVWGVISKMDEKGNYQTVVPEEKNENSFIFTEEDKMNQRESVNMGRVAAPNLCGNTTELRMISIDKNTNEQVAFRQDHIYIPNEINGVTLTPEEIQKLRKHIVRLQRA